MPDRRTFLKGMAAVGALALMPGTAARMLSWNTRPVLYGDGIHDDSPALQALVNGDDYVDIRDSATRVLDDGTLFISRGTYRISQPLRVDSIQGESHRRTVIEYSTFELGADDA